MQGDINSLPGSCGVVSGEIQEWIKGRRWIGIQKCFPQSGLADFANRQILSVVPRIAETELPVPTLEVLAKLAHLATQPSIEEIIVIGELFVSGTGVVSPAEPNPGGYWKTGPIRKEMWDSGIGNCEWIKRILDWYTDIKETKTYISAWDLERIGRKRHRCYRCIEK